MILRAAALATGLTGAAGLSQFPEFSQQYTQRLGGAVDELTRVVAAFDADAAALNLTREAALTQLGQGGEFGAARADSMQTTFARHERLSSALAELESAGPFSRARLVGQMSDPELARTTWSAFKPAVPLTFEGMVFAAVGFFAGWSGIAILIAALRKVFGRKRALQSP